MADDPFWSNLFKRRSREETELFDVLSKVPIFQDLSRREFDRLEGILHRRSFAIDEYIVKEGDVGVGMYIILSGEVRIVHLSADGEELVLTTFGAGDFFGDQALLEESPRTASAIAAEPCIALGFFRPDLLELIESNPHLGLKIIMRLSQMISIRLRQTNRLLKEARDRADELERQRLEAEARLLTNDENSEEDGGFGGTPFSGTAPPGQASGSA